jgi:hypothetical protein
MSRLVTHWAEARIDGAKLRRRETPTHFGNFAQHAAVKMPAVGNCNSITSAVFTPAAGNGSLPSAFGDRRLPPPSK